MPDIYSKSKRSQIMSKISGKETKPEIIVRKYLFSKGFRFRKNDKRLPGKPDIVLSKYRTVIFVHGCFWHGHDCKAGKLPKTRKDFWNKKISDNRKRDFRNIMEMQEQGWRVIIVWECDLKNKSKFESRMRRLQIEIGSYI